MEYLNLTNQLHKNYKETVDRQNFTTSKGFTIIEVLIVLAIAGLILLIVFLAVPALQRNGRNTTKRSDASKALGAVGEFVSNNNGTVPATANVGTVQTATKLSPGTTLSATIFTTTAAVNSGTVVGNSEIMIVTGVACVASPTITTANPLTNANFAALISNSSARSYVALYSVDAPNGQFTTQCVGS